MLESSAEWCRQLASSGRLALYIDIHGHSTKEDVFFYGRQGKGKGGISSGQLRRNAGRCAIHDIHGHSTKRGRVLIKNFQGRGGCGGQQEGCRQLASSGRLALYIDIHGHSTKEHVCLHTQKQSGWGWGVSGSGGASQSLENAPTFSS